MLAKSPTVLRAMKLGVSADEVLGDDVIPLMAGGKILLLSTLVFFAVEAEKWLLRRGRLYGLARSKAA